MSSVDVYADILFLINFGMDALCLCLTGRLLHRNLTGRRCCLSAAVGGVYGVLALLVEVNAVTAFGIDVLVCFFMCGLAFGRHRLWLTGGTYVLTSMVMGGVMTALYHWLNRTGVSEILPGGDEGVSSVAFVLLAVVGGLFTFVWGRIFRKSEGKRAGKIIVTLTINGQKLTVEGMVDSGNLLTDPIDGTPVVAVRKQLLLPFLSEKLQELMDTTPFPLESLADIPEASSLRLIPAQTATGDGILPALRPQTVLLEKEEEKGTPVSVACLVAPISMDNAPADALIPSALLL